MTTAALVLLASPVAAILAGFFLLYPKHQKAVRWPVLASCAAVTVSALYLAARARNGEVLDVTLGTWLAAGNLTVSWGLLVDGLNGPILAMIAVVGSLIHVYAAEYMSEDPDVGRFFLYFHGFFFSMLGLLLSNNYLQLFLFWEGVGVASFLLIGFWYGREESRRASLKAFLTNRVGDVGFFIALLLMAKTFGSLRFTDVFAGLPGASVETVTLIAFGLAWAAAAKSAQFPLHIWLPDAMEGPTPVSALMHAATMVTAGVILLSRSLPLVEAATSLGPVLTAVGALTALGAAVVAGVKADLKRILAYSTVSHLGLMTMAIGLGAAPAAVYHLVMHGFFKALLFLCAGSVLHGLGRKSATLDDVGGLRHAMPFTFAVFAAGALSLAGVPPFAGFFSKDHILGAALHHGAPATQAAAVLISAASAFYIFRMLFLVFLGPSPKQPAHLHPHEGGLLMKVPMALLAVFAAVGAFLFPAPGEIHLDVAAIGVGAAAVGAFAAWYVSLKRPTLDWDWKAKRHSMAGLMDGEFGWQRFVMRFAAAPAGRLAGFTARKLDKGGIDAAIEGAAASAWTLADAGAKAATGLLNDYVWWMLAGTAALAWVARG